MKVNLILYHAVSESVSRRRELGKNRREDSGIVKTGVRGLEIELSHKFRTENVR